MSVEYALWIDLETLGLNATDPIVEVGAILVENVLPFKEVARYHAVVKPASPYWKDETGDYVTTMHQKTGLWDEIDSGKAIEDVEFDLIQLVDQWAGVEQVYLAGSGVSHFDHSVLKTQMSELAGRFRYATFDVGVLRRMFEAVGRKDITTASYGATFTAGKQAHRALDDIEDHLNEWRTYAPLLALIPSLAPED